MSKAIRATSRIDAETWLRTYLEPARAKARVYVFEGRSGTAPTVDAMREGARHGAQRHAAPQADDRSATEAPDSLGGSIAEPGKVAAKRASRKHRIWAYGMSNGAHVYAHPRKERAPYVIVTMAGGVSEGTRRRAC